MDAISLKQVATWAGGELRNSDGAISTSRVCTDSRALQAGDLFVALEGENFDGHDFVAQAATIQAAGAMVHREVPGVRSTFPLVLVPDTLRGLQDLSGAYRRSLDVRVVAITGSNGKTSTKDLTAAVLKQRFRTNKTAGNLNNHIGVPLTLLSLSREDQAAVVEIGMNHPGEIAPLAALARPSAAIITNIGVAHIEYMGSREAIAQEKGTLAEAIEPSGTVILNADDDMTPGIARRCRAKVVTAGIGAGDVHASDVRALPFGMEFTIHAFGEKQAAAISVPGEHMVRNALLAVAAGLTFDLSLSECIAGLAALELSKGRLQRKEIGGLVLLDDTYNANPDSMVAGLSTLVGLPSAGRRIAVLGRMGELGAESEGGHRRVGIAAGASGLDCLIAVGDEPRWIAEAARAAGVKQVLHVADTEQAVTALRTVAQPGDVILVKGSRSAKMERVITALETGGTL